MFNAEMIIWHNGSFKRAKDLTLSIFTHAMHYGTAIFEGMRSYGGKIFKAKEHYLRLINSGILTDIPVEYSVEEMLDATYNVLQQNNLLDSYVRPIAWRGDEYLGVKSCKNSVNLAILAWDWGNYFGEDKVRAGLNLATTNFVRPDPRSTQTQAKASGLYFVGSVMQNQCYKDGYDDVLMLDYRGYVAECTSCNVFFIKNRELHTPIADCFLNGITRQTIIELSANMNYDICERHILPEELSNFEEAFVVGTAVEVMPIGSIWDKIIMQSTERVMEIRKSYLDLVHVKN